MYPAGVTNTEARGDVGAVGGAVDDGAGHLRVVEHGRDVVDDLLDGQCLRRQVGAGVVVPGHPHPAVLDHDHVEALGRRAAPQPAVKRDRCGTGSAGDDDQGMLRLASGAHVVQVEFRRSIRCHRATDRSHPG